MVAGKDAARPGEGKNSWLTGTAAWNWLTVTQYILGIHPTYEGLEIDPCLPAAIKEFTVKRKMRDSEMTITVRNPKGKSKGVTRIMVDGESIEGNVVKALPGKHTIEVEM